jgi:hypothetical protein
VEQGVDIEKASGWFPLMAASSNGHLEVVRYLLEQGANRDNATNDSMTPLLCAARSGCLEIVKLLMAYGAGLNVRDARERLPINYARTEEINQAIRDEPRRRLEEAPGKRETDQDRHSNAVLSASNTQLGYNEVW